MPHFPPPGGPHDEHHGNGTPSDEVTSDGEANHTRGGGSWPCWAWPS